MVNRVRLNCTAIPCTRLTIFDSVIETHMLGSVLLEYTLVMCVRLKSICQWYRDSCTAKMTHI
jgi:hypothetical protein